ncbi:MAG: hopanoid biosynthesis-associated protein HpnK [Blastocatellia bacterium]|nr:hopanoid biosynthesis-associated protein HpnK [Blastocatellia bacterium]
MKRLIVNADDFGKTEACNQAIIRAHDQGILTSCSLMVSGEACEQAVELARSRPRLAVGLHLVLICGKSALPSTEIPDLVDAEGNFSNDSFTAGVKYYFSKTAREQLRQEIWSQVARFAATGLPFSHVDGHLHMHMHPAAFPILVEAAAHYGCRRVRLPREPLMATLRLRKRNLAMKLVWWSVFHLLSRHSRKLLAEKQFSVVENVYGLLESGAMTEDFWLGLLPQLTAETNEIYSHPELISLDPKSDNHLGEAELAALLSARVRAMLDQHQLRLITYADLDGV